jgi:hypothetical protein
MHQVNRKNEQTLYSDAFCATGDICDSNMAMDQAFEDLKVEVFEEVNGESRMRDEVLVLWNAAWAEAKKNHFRRTLYLTAFDTYGFTSGISEITGFLSTLDRAQTYDPTLSATSCITLRNGFAIVDTGGGCTAWRQEFLVDGKPCYMLITDDDGMSHKIAPGEPMMVGVYGEENAEAMAFWTQANGPLGESNPPVFD